MKTLGQRIRELREAGDLSLRELAKSLEISAAFLSDVELGRRHPSDKVLADIARLLDSSVEELRRYDVRPLVEDFKRLASSNPVYGLAFRRVIDKGVSAEDLLKLAEEKSKRKRSK